jgi:hypothetical protein
MWIDPLRSYLIVRHDAANFDASQTPPVETLNHTYLVEKAERSPRGIWHPTLMRYTGYWTENGEKKARESVVRNYFEFNVKFSDDLFKPTDRPHEPLD